MKTTHLNDLFDKMEPEVGNKLDYKILIEEDESLKKVVENYKKICKNISSNVFVIRNHYEKESIRNVSAETITKFSMLDLNKLSDNEFFNKHIGYYITRLINYSSDKKHEIFSPREITYLGAKNEEKEIQITGNLDHSTCFKMRSGKVTINGNVGRYCGFKIFGGEITINGDCLSDVGNSMYNGTIIVNGNTDDQPGKFMLGGTLIINGNIGRQPGTLMEGGEIYVKNFPDSTHKFSSNNYEELPNGYTRITSKRK